MALKKHRFAKRINHQSLINFHFSSEFLIRSHVLTAGATLFRPSGPNYLRRYS
jgi:hypothetical protein